MGRHKDGIAKPAERKHLLMKKTVIFLIDLYRIYISPFVPTECRFHPTCSCYMKESIEKKGIFKGTLHGLKRLLKCNPLHPGGYDPVT
jgi:hypothetical protein